MSTLFNRSMSIPKYKESRTSYISTLNLTTCVSIRPGFVLTALPLLLVHIFGREEELNDTRD